jgi:tetratricopeptide (TPR) repeat protein
VIFGFISIVTQYQNGALSTVAMHFNPLERLALGAYAFVTYLWKALVPVNLCCFYPYPAKSGGTLPVACYAYLVVAIALLFIGYRLLRKSRVGIFGLLFFMINILPVLQFLPVGNAMLADRYTYLPYLGLFMFTGWQVQHHFEGAGQQAQVVIGAICMVCISMLGYSSYQRCKVWYDSTSLWTDELKKEPTNVPVAYFNLGSIYYDRWYHATNRADRQTAFDSAFYLLKRTTELWPDSVAGYQPLGMLYLYKKNYDGADACFRTALHLSPSAAEYANYGNLLMKIGRPDEALKQFDTAIAENPALFAPYFNRGKILLAQNHRDAAIRDFSAAIALNPRYGELYYQRSFCDTQILGKGQALKDVEAAISLGFKNVDYVYYRCLKGQ